MSELTEISQESKSSDSRRSAMHFNQVVPFFGVLLLSLTILSGCASVSDHRYASGKCGYTNNEIAAIRARAEVGDANSQYELGKIYFTGTCVKMDDRTGIEWIHKSAEQGDVRAQSLLGWAYSMEGYSVTYDGDQAKKWTSKAAEQGDIRSQKQLAYAYLGGKWGLDKDTEKSAYWYQKAAEQGDAIAQRRLGEGYEIGTYGFERNSDKALYWYGLAAEQGDKHAEKSLVKLECELYPDSCEQMAEARIAEKERQAQEEALTEYLRIKSDAQLGNSEAQYLMGVFHAIGSDPNDSEAKETIAESTNDELPPSTSLEGIWYGKIGAKSHFKLELSQSDSSSYTGRVLLHSRARYGKDCVNTDIYLTPATENEYTIQFKGSDTCTGEGILAYSGALRGKIELRGEEKYLFVKKLGTSFSTVNWLGGQAPFIQQDIEKAQGWFQKSAQQNYAPAQFALGLMYQEGIGDIPADLAEAKSLYQNAADQGNSYARIQLCALDDECDPAKHTDSELTVGGAIGATFISALFAACTVAMYGLFFLCIPL